MKSCRLSNRNQQDNPGIAWSISVSIFVRPAHHMRPFWNERLNDMVRYYPNDFIINISSRKCMFDFESQVLQTSWNSFLQFCADQFKMNTIYMSNWKVALMRLREYSKWRQVNMNYRKFQVLIFVLASDFKQTQMVSARRLSKKPSQERCQAVERSLNKCGETNKNFLIITVLNWNK